MPFRQVTKFPKWLKTRSSHSFFSILLPSFFQRSERPCDNASVRSLSSTAWLDGLRGVACFIVFLLHLTATSFGRYEWAYGLELEDYVYSPLQLPFVRLIYSGCAMVHIFFVISGFSLSLKPLKSIRNRELDKLLETVSSTIFRRGVRLFLPVFALAVGLTAWRILEGLYHADPDVSLANELRELLNGIWTIGFRQIWEWEDPQGRPIAYSLWTIPIEYGCSLVLMVALVGLSRVKTSMRLGSLLLLGIISFMAGHWGPTEFFAGMALAEVSLMQSADAHGHDGYLPLKREDCDDIPSPKQHGVFHSMLRILHKPLMYLSMILGLFLASWPSRGPVDVAPWYSTLYRMTPEPYQSRDQSAIMNAWLCISGLLIVASMQQMELLQRPFVTRPLQYLGEISFPLYLVHLPILQRLSPACTQMIWSLAGGAEEAEVWNRILAWFLSALLMSVPIIWVSDIFKRVVDTPTIKFARWLERICISSD